MGDAPIREERRFHVRMYPRERSIHGSCLVKPQAGVRHNGTALLPSTGSGWHKSLCLKERRHIATTAVYRYPRKVVTIPALSSIPPTPPCMRPAFCRCRADHRCCPPSKRRWPRRQNRLPLQKRDPSALRLSPPRLRRFAPGPSVSLRVANEEVQNRTLRGAARQ